MLICTSSSHAEEVVACKNDTECRAKRAFESIWSYSNGLDDCSRADDDIVVSCVTSQFHEET